MDVRLFTIHQIELGQLCGVWLNSKPNESKTSGLPTSFYISLATLLSGIFQGSDESEVYELLLLSSQESLTWAKMVLSNERVDDGSGCYFLSSKDPDESAELVLKDRLLLILMPFHRFLRSLSVLSGE